MKFKNIFAFIFLHFVFHAGYAQVQTTFKYTDGYNICGESNLEIELKNTSSTGIASFIAEFKLNNAMNPLLFGSTLPANTYLMSVTGNTVKIAFDTLFKPSDIFTISVKMSSRRSCELTACGQFLTTTDSLLLKINNGLIFYNTQKLGSPCITYDETLFSNRVVSAFLGDTVIRKIVLVNTGGGTFNGTLQIKDVFGPFVELYSITCSNQVYTASSSSLVNDSTYLFKGYFTDVQNGDSIVIIEKVVIKKCIKEEEGKSSIFIDWGCGTSACNHTIPYPVVAQILKSKKKPDVIITKVSTPESLCINSKTSYSYVIKNQGTRPAVNLKFTLSSSNSDTYTYIDKSSLTLKDTSGLTLVSSIKSPLIPTHPIPHSFVHSCIIPDPLYAWQFEFAELAPEDSFIVECEGFHCCPADDTSNINILFETWKLNVAYDDECKEESFAASSGDDIDNELWLTQFYEPLVTYMRGNQETATFELLNNNFSTNFYKFNKKEMAFKINIKLDTGLVYVPNTIKISSVYGYTMYPDKEEILSGAGVDGYEDLYLQATFTLPDTLVKNPIFYERFMRNSSVLFNLSAVCPAKVPNSRFTQEFFVIPDKTCTQACEILVSTYTYKLNILCPGCVTPGWIISSYNSKRTSIGEKDDDNNRLPDNTTFVKADKNKIKLNRCIPGDTIQTDMFASVQDGDPVTGKSTVQLENNGIKSFHFRYSYLKSALSQGRLYDLINVKVYIYDTDKSAITSGIDSLILPLSAVTKIPNANDSLADATFFFDLSLETLFNNGLINTYEYDPGDHIRIVCNYIILEPSNFYLTNPPSKKDPWFAIQQASMLSNAFTNILYLTGQRNTPTTLVSDAGPSFEKDPTSLDSTMIYWCEGNGIASTIIGKNQNFSIDLPKVIQCKSRASLTVSLNPAGSVFINAFPFEYRNFLSVDSIQATVPDGYTFTNWTISNVVPKPDGSLEYISCTVVDSLKGINEKGPVISIPIYNLFKRETQFGNDECLQDPVYGDEKNTTSISFDVVPECDLQTEVPIFYASPILYYTIGSNKVKYTGVNTAEYCVIDVCIDYPSTPNLLKVNSELKVSPLTNEIMLSQQTFCYPVSIEETSGVSSYFTFLKVKSLNNKVKASTLTHKETHRVYHADASGLFKLDTINGKELKEYELCLLNICGELISRDTILLIYGYDCNDYPDATLSNICKADTIEHYVVPAALSFSGTLEGPDDVTMCKPFELVSEYQITGVGGIRNMLFTLNTTHTSIKAAQITLNEQTTSILDYYTDSTATFDLQEILYKLDPKGAKAGDNIKIKLTLNTDCQYTKAMISTQVKIITSACDTLVGDTLRYEPMTLTGFPKPDTKTLSAQFSVLQNLGGELTVRIKAINTGSIPTKNQTRISFMLPKGFSYKETISDKAPVVISDSMIVWEYDAGINASTFMEVNTTLTYNSIPCDSIPIRIHLGDITNGCASIPCVQRDSVYSFKVPVICRPCAPFVSLSEKCKGLPIENVISWTYNKQGYCPDDNGFIYRVYYSPSVSGPYQLLASGDTITKYTHENLTSYDGCYYVMVTDKDGLKSDSSIFCKTTCIDKFECSDLIIYNLITADNNEKNETFYIDGAYVPLSVEIYNKWGDRVFKSEDYKNDWNVTTVLDGVYYYSVTPEGVDKKCTGWVHIIR